MKEYKVGEYFTTEDGKTVQCVRSNGLCSGCVFLTKIGSAPRCKAGDIDCTDCSREDGQSVIFEELEELKHHTEYPPFDSDREYQLFERFQHNGVVAECRKHDSSDPCRDCVIYPCAVTYHNCMSFKRMDKVDVFYKKLEDVTEE